MDRKTYIKSIYSRYWLNARERKYGFLEYDKNLCEYVFKNVARNSKLLDVGCGTGYPFANFFDKAGHEVYGIDISPALIEKCKNIYPNIKAKTGDAENIEHADNFFDAVYCFHSSWYFCELNKVIDEMIRVTKPGGTVIFDIMNYNNGFIKNNIEKEKKMNSGFGKAKKYFKNIAKIILQKGTPDWHFVNYEIPAFPESIYSHLDSKNIAGFDVLTREEDDSIKIQKSHDPFVKYPRLIFKIKK